MFLQYLKGKEAWLKRNRFKKINQSQFYVAHSVCPFDVVSLLQIFFCNTKAKLDQTQLLTGPNNQAKIHFVAGIIF